MILRNFLLFLILSACASQKYLGSNAHSAFDNREWEKAAAIYKKESKKASSNQLLFMLDHASSLIADRKYKEATEVLLQAEDLAEIKDYTSISEEVGTMATSDNVRGYKGEDFEKVLINVYLALCFAVQDDLEGAQVEARKINLLLNRMITEGKRKYEESPFARYLSAMLWESSGDWNAAYIDYKYLYDLNPDFPGLGSDLIFLANRLGFRDDESQWRQKFPQANLRKWNPEEGELVVFFERGRSPRKVPRDSQSSTLPRFVPRGSPDSTAAVYVNDALKGQTHEVLDIEETSIRYLEDRIGRMMAAKLLGVATKGAIAAGIGKASKDDDLGVLVFYALMATEQADLRSWLTLPAEIQMLRVPLGPGEYSIKVDILSDSGSVLNSLTQMTKITVKKKTFLMFR